MKRLIKFLRLLSLIGLMLLAMLGIGLSGGVPPTTVNRRTDPIEHVIEMEVSSKEDNKEYKYFKQE